MSVLIKNPTTVVGKGAVIEQIDIESLNKIQPSRFIDKVYFNKGLNDERMMEILSQINYYDLDGLLINIVFCPNELANRSDKIIAIVKLQIEDFLVGHMIILLQDANLTPLLTPLWFSQQLYDFTHQEGIGDELETPFGTVKVEKAGWQDYSDYTFGFNITDYIFVSDFCRISLDGMPIGADNELLKPIFSTTPFIYYKKELKGVLNGDTLQANVGGEYFDGKTVDVEKLLDEKKLPLNIDVEYAKIKVDDTEVDLIGEYDGTTIEITGNGTLELEPLILENKLPLNVEVNVAGGGGESEEIDTVALYRQTRNPNWPHLPLPSEIAATSNKDTVYLLYNASGEFVCPAFTLTYDGECLITIEKYMNTALVSSEILTNVISGTAKYLQYDYTNEDWNSYNYLLIKIEMQGDSASLNRLNLRITPQYNGVNLNTESSNGLLEISGNANICEVSFGGSSEKANTDLTYFSFNGIASTSLSHMFNYCFSLITLPEIRFSVTSDYKYTSSVYMFYFCSSLQAVPLFDTSNVTGMSSMFQTCHSLRTVPLFDTSSVRGMGDMFEGCYGLKTVPLFDTSSVTNMERMFSGCRALQAVPLFDTSSVTNMGSMFSNCYALQGVPLFDTSNVTSMRYMFQNCNSLRTVPFFITNRVKNMEYMFSSCLELQTVPLFDTSSVTNMERMFYSCHALQAVPLFDTSKVTGMSYMFYSCLSLKTIPLFDTSSVTGMSSMFQTCRALQAVPLFDTSNVKYMGSMFEGCYALQAVPLFDTSSVTGMGSMFKYCSSLQAVPLFDTSNVTGMGSMFTSCYALVDINMYNIKVAFSLSNSTFLTREAIVKVLNNLATVTSSKTLTLGSTNLAKLTDEDKAIATDKGWTLA